MNHLHPLKPVVCAAGDGDAKTVEIVLIPDGEVESRKGAFKLDAQSAKAVIEDFEEHGTELPIDFEHQSLGGQYSSPDGKAPAAGWIKALRYEKGRGLVGTVEWTPDAANLIRERKYKYLSPVAMIRKRDRRVVSLHSAALTNTPAIPRMEALAAKRSWNHERNELMPNDEMMDGGSPDQLVGELKAALKAKGVELGDEATREEILRAAINSIGGGGEDEGKAEDSKVAASVRDELGLDDKASSEKVLVALGQVREKAGASVEAVALRKELNELKTRESERRSKELVALGVKAQKINPNNKPLLERYVAMARRDPIDFEAMLDKMEPLIASGRIIGADAGDTNAKGNGKEEEMIAASVKAHDGSFEKALVALQTDLMRPHLESGLTTREARKRCTESYPTIFAV